MAKTSRREFLRAIPAGLAAARLAHAQNPAGSGLQLWYTQPAAQWTEALPLGNGRLGAMVFGGVPAERIQLNEDTLWSGHPRDWNNPDAIEYLPVVRRLVLEEEKYVEAGSVCQKMQGPFNESYLPLGNLRLKLEPAGGVSGYWRELDLDTAIASVFYRADGPPTECLRSVGFSPPARRRTPWLPAGRYPTAKPPSIAPLVAYTTVSARARRRPAPEPAGPRRAPPESRSGTPACLFLPCVSYLSPIC